jgi:hypothetical protein
MISLVTLVACLQAGVVHMGLITTEVVGLVVHSAEAEADLAYMQTKTIIM